MRPLIVIIIFTISTTCLAGPKSDRPLNSRLGVYLGSTHVANSRYDDGSVAIIEFGQIIYKRNTSMILAHRDLERINHKTAHDTYLSFRGINLGISQLFTLSSKLKLELEAGTFLYDQNVVLFNRTINTERKQSPLVSGKFHLDTKKVMFSIGFDWIKNLSDAEAVMIRFGGSLKF